MKQITITGNDKYGFTDFDYGGKHGYFLNEVENGLDYWLVRLGDKKATFYVGSKKAKTNFEIIDDLDFILAFNDAFGIVIPVVGGNDAAKTLEVI